MDFNFADLKKEAAATADDIFSSATSAANAASKKVTDTYDDLLGDLSAGDSAGSSGSAANVSSGAQDDNAHTEKYFANEQKNLDFGDPQAFVQRMSAGAKEAQEQLDAKFAQQTDDFGDFLAQTGKAAKHGIGELTSDFMNVERGLYGDAPKPAAPPAAVPAVAPAVPAAPPAAVPAVAPAVPAPPKPAKEPEVDLMGSFSQPMSAPLQPFAATAPTASDKFYDDDDDDYFSKPNPAAAAAVATATAAAAAAPAPVVANKDSDTDSPSASYTPSPAKKPIADALKEQDHEQFISSEDLLSDFKEERTATPPVAPKAAAAASAPAPTPIPAPATAPASALVTDLDDEEIVVKPTPKPEPVKPAAKPVEPPKVKAPAQQPQKQQQQQQQQQPKIVSVEEIFYKYGLVESLIYWRDVKKSGIVFGAGLITLVAISSFSVISVFAYLSLLALVGTVAFRVYKSVTQAVQKTNDGHPFKEYLELDLTLSQEKVQHIAGVAVAHINGFVAELRRLFLVEDIIDSIKFGVILWVFTYIGAWFNGMTLVILAFVSLFTLPKVYENNKQSIDTYLDLVRNKLTEITDKIRVALPIGNKKPVAAAAAESDKDK
ncbi:reticulon-1 isoform X2 [Drosophila novamexicana]|uniref:reticulon-1 isoform X2 n=1 Tax=Drosophila novamexicana TaxID=47314 RepID=UPI0011E5EF58|nr:reticulon-1 isoform X2 [Drosophila novamexicana]